MKFKNYIETESGIKDTSASPGTAGQLLSSTVAGTSWIDQNTISSGTSEVVDIQVKNISSANGGINLVKGDPVYIYGSVGASARLYVDLADADSTATNNLGDGKMPCVGLLDQDLSPNGEGTATVVGKLRNLITNPIDGSVPNENDTVYVKSGGGLTLTKPTGSTNLIQNVGQVGRVSTSADGNIVVAALLRSNDVPNLPEGRIWIGDGNTIVSDTVYVDEPNNRVGIGTNSPTSRLHSVTTVSGPVDYTNRAAVLGINNSTDTLYANSVGVAGKVSTSGGFAIYGDASLAGGWAGYFDGKGFFSGNVGIGTTSPSAKLDVVQVTAANGEPALHLIGPNTNTGLTSSVLVIEQGDGKKITIDGNDIDVSSGDLFINDYSKEDVTFGGQIKVNGGGSPVGDSYISNGNFGVGTTSPQAKLHVSNGLLRTWSPSSGTSAIFESTVSNRNFVTLTAANEAELWFGNAATQAKGRIRYEMAGNNMEFWTNATQKMVINSSGNVGIGITDPTQKLQVNGNIQTSFLYLNNGTSLFLGATFFGTRVQISSSNGLSVLQGSTYKPVYASAFTTSSDYRLKSNIVPLENAISRLNQLEVHRFNWNDRLDESKVDGFIAHEVSSVVPEAILGEKDGTHPDGTPDYQGIDQSKIVPLLTAAIQEAISKIEQLETRIQVLENK